MIQRIQTLYLLLAFVTTSILLFYSALDFKDGGILFHAKPSVYHNIRSKYLTLLSVVSYKKDKISLLLAD
jgi:hypothetical protein